MFDEMITGFRWSAGGAQAVYGVTPDLSCWGKAMGNGFPLSALAGRREFMELGGLRTDRDRVFLLSTTHGPETSSLAAFRAVVRAYTEAAPGDDPVARMERAGRLLADGVTRSAAEHGLSQYVQVVGRPSCLVFVTRDADQVPSQAFRTLFLQELLHRGVLGQSFVTSAAHTEADVAYTIDAVDGRWTCTARRSTSGRWPDCWQAGRWRPPSGGRQHRGTFPRSRVVRGRDESITDRSSVEIVDAAHQ